MTGQEIVVTSDLIWQAVGWVAATFLVSVTALIAWLASNRIKRIETDIAMKADKEHMTGEIEGLRSELRESRDQERRASAERFSEFSTSIKERMVSMEHNLEAKLDMVLRFIEKDGK